MQFTVSTLLCLALGAQAFSPNAFSAKSVSQMVQEGARFQPLHADAAAALEEDDDAPAPEDYIVQVGELEGDEVEDAGVEDDGEPPAWAVLEERLAATRATHRRHETDTGSPEFQVAGMTERIFYLTKHMQTHPKDFSTRRGLVALVNKRRRLLNYLVKEDVQRYKDVVASLGIRHKASGAVRSKEDKYSRYPGQQAIKKHLVKKK